mmetsp:Transcript_88463/g.211197  ORF Transcript_88463/g.211197 Transcript_88463/m.211197 type:complete len:202 (-) Transcript_88463:639-1244(-)
MRASWASLERRELRSSSSSLCVSFSRSRFFTSSNFFSNSALSCSAWSTSFCFWELDSRSSTMRREVFRSAASWLRFRSSSCFSKRSLTRLLSLPEDAAAGTSASASLENQEEARSLADAFGFSSLSGFSSFSSTALGCLTSFGLRLMSGRCTLFCAFLARFSTTGLAPRWRASTMAWWLLEVAMLRAESPRLFCTSRMAPF